MVINILRKPSLTIAAMLTFTLLTGCSGKGNSDAAEEENPEVAMALADIDLDNARIDFLSGASDEVMETVRAIDSINGHCLSNASLINPHLYNAEEFGLSYEPDYRLDLMCGQIGNFRVEDMAMVDSVFASTTAVSMLPSNVRLLWSNYAEEGPDGAYHSLYAVVENEAYPQGLGRYISKAEGKLDKSVGPWTTDVVFTEEGAKVFENIMQENVGNILAIVADGRIWSAPRITSVISGGHINISGDFDETDAKVLAALINAARDTSRRPTPTAHLSPQTPE